MAVSSSYEPVVRALQQEFKQALVAVALFGSVARGQAKPTSDLDFLVVLSDTAAGMDRRRHAYNCIHKVVTADGVSRDITILDVDEKYILDQETEITTIMMNVAADALILYDPKGKLLAFINGVRRLIELAGLERYEVEGGKYGWKPRDGVLREVEIRI